ncbi:MerR family transcriptional regulator [Litorihabitans aurantiacus]|uniref:MerR family transcriptional regulator n=1 Tax=Litorihabitans aurantiacus TaxID=1930061 RepID=A0AA37XGP6_9MICO|nr:MerR family transcriptional regulator [Litorihabitans aurantiacus]GMA32838.1 MerR family transcriptional regulator [Litorihabitans aurantiacus]
MTYSIAEVADRTALTTHTLRYYERDDLLLQPVSRDGAGRRRYDDEDVRWIVMLTRLRSTGMPIREVRRYAELVRNGPGNEDERLEILRGHRRDVLAQLAAVTAHLGAIEGKIALYEDALARGS